MMFVMFAYVVDPRNKRLVVASVVGLFCWLTTDELIQAVKDDGDGKFPVGLCSKAGVGGNSSVNQVSACKQTLPPPATNVLVCYAIIIVVVYCTSSDKLNCLR